MGRKSIGFYIALIVDNRYGLSKGFRIAIIISLMAILIGMSVEL